MKCFWTAGIYTNYFPVPLAHGQKMERNSLKYIRKISRQWKDLNPDELSKYFHQFCDISYRDIEIVCGLAERRNYFQILYSYDIRNTLILQQYFLDNEMYLDCADVQDQIENHNKLTGDCLPYLLKDLKK